MGWIGDDVLHSLYRIADLTVVPVDLRAVRARRAGGDGLAAARASSPTPAACARSCPTTRVGLRFQASDPRSLGRMVERVLTDDALRDRLVAEASEHVLRFDWADVARQTLDAYTSLLRRAPTASSS